VWTNKLNSGSNAFQRQAGSAKLQEARTTAAKSKALDRTGVVLPQQTLDAVVEGRNRGVKELEFQERTGIRQEML
jgi:hypothetical protein